MQVTCSDFFFAGRDDASRCGKLCGIFTDEPVIRSVSLSAVHFVLAGSRSLVDSNKCAEGKGVVIISTLQRLQRGSTLSSLGSPVASGANRGCKGQGLIAPLNLGIIRLEEM